MMYGVNTVDPGVDSTATQGDTQSSHLRVEDTCVGCHHAGKDGPSHTLQVTSFVGCEGNDCHDSDMSQGVIAKEDYDGDGSKEKTTLEIEGLWCPLPCHPAEPCSGVLVREKHVTDDGRRASRPGGRRLFVTMLERWFAGRMGE